MDLAVLKTTKTLDKIALDMTGDETNFVSRSLAAQSFSSYLADSDTDTENSVLHLIDADQKRLLDTFLHTVVQK